jgi:plastocyanin
MKKYLVFTIIAILTAVLLLGGTGCSTSKTTAQTPSITTTAASFNTVNIVNFTFTPGTLTVKAGTMVTWTNNDTTTHRPTSDTGVFDSGDLAPGATFSFTFNNRGTFSYHCSIHPYMTGKVIVQ